MVQGKPEVQSNHHPNTALPPDESGQLNQPGAGARSRRVLVHAQSQREDPRASRCGNGVCRRRGAAEYLEILMAYLVANQSTCLTGGGA